MSMFKYDVAISFLQCDEGLALEISAALAGRVQSFVFSEHQKELAGRDGHDKFSEVFGCESRIVVVLYRPDWGKTRWTRVEETAIKNRGHEHGYDFLLMAVMDNSAGVPLWLPKTRIWYDVMHYGVAGAASAIEARVRDSGGTVHAESALEYASRLAERKKIEAERAALLWMPGAVSAAEEEGGSVLDAIDKIVEKARESGLSLARDRRPNQWLVVYSTGFTLEAGYHVPSSNTAIDVYLRLAIHEGRIGPGFYDNSREPRKLSEDLFIFAFGASLEERYWRRKGDDSKTYTSDALADHAVKLFLRRLDDKPTRGSSVQSIRW